MPRSSSPLACVIGEIDLVRALGLAGIRSVPVAPPGDLTRYSRFAVGAIDWVDPWSKPAELVDRLLAFGKAQEHAPVLFYDSDGDLLMVSRNRDQLDGTFRFVVPDATLVRRHATWRPLVRGKALRVTRRSEFEQLWPRLAEAGVDVLVQELIEGPESRIESYHVYRDREGTFVGEFTGRKIRTYPTDFGYSTAVEITDSADVRELGRDLTRRLDLRGVAKFDFKRDGGGRLNLLEINPRFNLWHYPGAKAGVNLPELVYRDLVGAPRPQLPVARAGVRWCSLAHDWQAARSSGISIARWLPWALGSDALSPFAWNDPAPAFFTAGWRIAQLLRRATGDSERQARSIRPP